MFFIVFFWLFFWNIRNLHGLSCSIPQMPPGSGQLCHCYSCGSTGRCREVCLSWTLDSAHNPFNTSSPQTRAYILYIYICYNMCIYIYICYNLCHVCIYVCVCLCGCCLSWCIGYTYLCWYASVRVYLYMTKQRWHRKCLVMFLVSLLWLMTGHSSFGFRFLLRR